MGLERPLTLNKQKHQSSNKTGKIVNYLYTSSETQCEHKPRNFKTVWKIKKLPGPIRRFLHLLFTWAMHIVGERKATNANAMKLVGEQLKDRSSKPKPLQMWRCKCEDLNNLRHGQTPSRWKASQYAEKKCTPFSRIYNNKKFSFLKRKPS